MKKLFLFLTFILCVNLMWGETKTIIVDGSKLTSTATTTESTLTYGGIDFIFSQGAKIQTSTSATNAFSTYPSILIGRSGAYIYNNTAIPGTITKFEIYANAGASAKVSVGVTFSTEAINEYATGDNTYTATLSTTNNVYDCSSKLPEGAKYFWYQVTNANNSQVQFRITYEESTESQKELFSLEVSGTPTKNSYFEGDEFDPAGLVVTGTYSDASKPDVTDQVEWTITPKTLEFGTTSVSVTATIGEITDTKKYSVTVKKLPTYEGNYVIYAKRSAGTYWMMTNDLGTATTKRFTAKSTELTSLPTSTTSLESNIWTITKVDGGYKIKSLENNKYIDWTSGNSATLSDEGKILTITPSTEGSCIISYVEGNRTLEFNGNSGSDYFAFYTGTQVQDLYLVPVTITTAYNVIISDQIANGQVSANVLKAMAEDEITLTITPADGYKLSTLSVSDGNQEINVSTDYKFTMPASDVTVSATFEELPTYTITWNVNGQKYKESEFYEGTMLEFPSNPTAYGYQFVGWSANEISTPTDIAPTFVTPEAVTANAAYYAVFAKKGNVTPTPYQVGDEGKYVIAAKQDDKWYALPTNPTVNSGKIAAQEIIVSKIDDIHYVSTENADGFAWTIEKSGNYYKISDGNSYIYHSNGGASGTDLSYTENSLYKWNLSLFKTENGEIDGRIIMAGVNGSTVNNRGLLFSNTNIGGYSLTNKTTSGYYMPQFLPIMASALTGYTTSPAAPEIQLLNEAGAPAGWVNLGTYKFGTNETIEGERLYELTVANYDGEYTFSAVNEDLSNSWITLIIDNSDDASILDVNYEINVPTAAAQLNTTFQVVACSGTEYDATKVIAKTDIRVYVDVNATGAYTPTSLENSTISENVQKVMREGKIFIIRDGVTYSIDGRIVK